MNFDKHDYEPEQMEEMRSWISDCEWKDIDDAWQLSDEEVIEVVERNYDGGIDGLLRAAYMDYEGMDKPNLSNGMPQAHNSQEQGQDQSLGL